MEQIIKYLICIHAFFGGAGLLAGLGSILAKKGGFFHKKSGKLFSISMICSVSISMPVSLFPSSKNYFLFMMGFFTIYLVLSGNRALKRKKKKAANWMDFTISGSMLVFSLAMLGFGFYNLNTKLSLGVLNLFFGSLGLLLSVKDFLFYKSKEALWLKAHIGKMVGAYIASITAFIVAGLGIGTLVAWISPTILGTIYIYYWEHKLKA